MNDCLCWNRQLSVAKMRVHESGIPFEGSFLDGRTGKNYKGEIVQKLIDTKGHLH